MSSLNEEDIISRMTFTWDRFSPAEVLACIASTILHRDWHEYPLIIENNGETFRGLISVVDFDPMQQRVSWVAYGFLLSDAVGEDHNFKLSANVGDEDVSCEVEIIKLRADREQAWRDATWTI